MPTLGSGPQVPPSTALDNLSNVWLYNQNPELQVSTRRRFNQYTAGLNMPATSITGVTQFLNGTPETFDINDGLLIEAASITLTDQSTNASPATSLTVQNGSLALAFLPTSGVYEPIAQMVTTGLVIPTESGTVTTVHGLGLTINFVTPQSPLLYLIRDLFLNQVTGQGGNISPPQKLIIAFIVTVYNPNAAAHSVNAMTLLKYRQVRGIGNEG